MTKILTDCIASDLKARNCENHIYFSKVSCFTVENKTMQNPAFSVELTTYNDEIIRKHVQNQHLLDKKRGASDLKKSV